MSIDSGKVPNSVDLQVNGITYMSMIPLFNFNNVNAMVQVRKYNGSRTQMR